MRASGDILVIEDDAALGDFILTALGEEGYIVRVVPACDERPRRCSTKTCGDVDDTNECEHADRVYDDARGGRCFVSPPRRIPSPRTRISSDGRVPARYARLFHPQRDTPAHLVAHVRTIPDTTFVEKDAT